MDKNYFHVSIKTWIEGVIETPLAEEESQARLQATLDAQHGQGMAEIEEFRPATPEEIAETIGAIAELSDEDEPIEGEEPIGNNTKTVH